MANVQPPPPERVALFLANARFELPTVRASRGVLGSVGFTAVSWMSLPCVQASTPLPFHRTGVFSKLKKKDSRFSTEKRAVLSNSPRSSESL